MRFQRSIIIRIRKFDMASRTILVLAVQVLAAFAVQPDKTCADPTTGVYNDRAFICNDTLPTATCESLYPLAVPGTNKPAVGNDYDRPIACYKVDKMDNQKSYAIAQCAKTCGFCCESPAFSCKNSPRPIHYLEGCDKVTRAQCNDRKFRTLIARDCPNVCGFCQEESCKDDGPDCDRSFCHSINLQEFVKKSCIKTCGLCSDSPVVPTTQAGNVPTTMAPGPVVTSGPVGPTNGPNTRCIDHKNCAAWARNGYCSHPFYTDADRAKYCPNTCGLCSMIGK